MVQLHHIFPRQWCKDNKGKYNIIEELGENHFANLIPLTAASNNKWRSNGPATAINQFNLAFNSYSNTYELGFIDSDSFEFLRNDNIKEFWEKRADKIADELYKAQFVS